jgi:hypothetical protein
MGKYPPYKLRVSIKEGKNTWEGFVWVVYDLWTVFA